MKYIALFFISVMTLVSCQQENSSNDSNQSSKETSTELNTWLDEQFDAEVDKSPMFQTSLGIRKDYDQLDNLTDAFDEESFEQRKQLLEELKKWDDSSLDEKTLTTKKLMVNNIEREVENRKYNDYNYMAHQMRGIHDRIPAFMINMHKVSSKEEAEAYVARLRDTKRYFDEGIAQMKKREELGIVPPLFVFDHIIGSSENVISGEPFTREGQSPLLEDFTKKVNQLDIDDEEKEELIADAKDALLKEFSEGYGELIAFFKDQKTRATTDDGVWKFKDGENFYKSRLKNFTTTDLTANEIHQIGLDEIDRIHGEMRDIMTEVGFEGNLQEFFKFMREDEQFYYSDSEEGRKQYLDKANAVIADMDKELDGLFKTKPKADLIVKAVEPFREKAAGKAFYQRPAPDGSRPGTYYANLYDMEAMPSYQLEALAFHEAIPGHHMQLAIMQEIEGLPKYRTLGGGYTAYSEGWGLYSEYVPKELGFYEDPYSDFGRLAMELWRCIRLVVDTGIHSKKWTREEAIDFYTTNSPNAKSDAVKMVERHIVMPGQATAYKIGQLKILELRQKAKDALGDDFDIREFHDVILTNGPLPLNVLEEMVDRYISEKKA